MSVLPTRSIRPLLDAVASQAALPHWDGVPGAVWLEALVLQESGGKADAVRYEPRHDATPRGADRPGTDDGRHEDDKSYGLMQVLGSNVRRLCGAAPEVRLDYSFLHTPLLGVGFAMCILAAELKATSGDVARALARYNGGPTGDRPENGGRMRRQDYVDGVRQWSARVQRDRGQPVDGTT